MNKIIQSIVVAVLTFLFGKAEIAVQQAESEKKIDEGATHAVETKDTTELEDSLSD